jgi:hypothetical protein
VTDVKLTSLAGNGTVARFLGENRCDKSGRHAFFFPIFLGIGGRETAAP